MEILFAWFIFSILVGVWNSNRGNSFWAGFLLSALLSPLIGFIIVAITKKNPKSLEQREIATGEMKKCPYCAELIRKEAVKCRFCGSDLVQGISSPPTVKQIPTLITIECPNCHVTEEVNRSDAKTDVAYTKFGAHYNSFFGDLKLRCLACDRKFSLPMVLENGVLVPKRRLYA
jgi:RNA polymerase subunit RPABC4/transcription elongation factor Spt4